MQKFSDVKLDISKMSLEEMEETRKHIRELLTNLNHHIMMIKIVTHKHSSKSYSYCIDTTVNLVVVERTETEK